MEYQEFSTIYKALKSRSSDNNLNKDNVIEAIKNQLLPNSDAYKEWKEGNFSLDHVFTTDGLQPQNTLLMRACESGDLKVGDLLLKAEASVNVAAGDKNPFTVAIENEWEGSKEDAKAIVDLLIGKVDAHVSAADENVNNTIAKAVERGNLRVFKALMEKGANVNIQVYGMPLLKWAEEHQSDSKIEEKDMEEIINTLKAPSKEKEQTDPEIATSTNIDNLKQPDEAESIIPTVPDETTGEISPEGRDEEYALECQIKEITLSTGGQLPENNSTNLLNEKNDLSNTSPLIVPATTYTGDVSATINSNTPPASTTVKQPPVNNGASLPGNKKNTVGATATPVNSSNTSPAPTTVNQAPVKNDTNFLSKHKGKIALSVGVLCVAGAIAAYVLAYPVVALALAVLAAVILIGAGIAKFCGKVKNPSVDKVFDENEQLKTSSY